MSRITKRTAAQLQAEAAAAFIVAQRPQHTRASLAAQRQRINAWVRKWQTDRYYRARMLEKAQAQQQGIAFRVTDMIRQEKVS